MMASKRVFKPPVKKQAASTKGKDDTRPSKPLSDSEYKEIFDAVVHVQGVKSPVQAESMKIHATEPREGASLENSQSSQPDSTTSGKINCDKSAAADSETQSEASLTNKQSVGFKLPEKKLSVVAESESSASYSEDTKTSCSEKSSFKRPKTLREALKVQESNSQFSNSLSQLASSSSLLLTQDAIPSQPPKHLRHRERLQWLQDRRGVGLYIQCDNCKKWRWSDIDDPVDVPKQWTCRLNPDTNYNKCVIPEKPISVYIEEDLIHNVYTAGSIVWAKLFGYPWWPAMVDDCPDTEQYYWLDGYSDIPTHYHVVFFDYEHNEVTRSWVPVRDLISYKDEPHLDRKFSMKAVHKCRVDSGKLQAEAALKLRVKQRLQRYSFLARWTKEIVTPPASDSELEDSSSESKRADKKRRAKRITQDRKRSVNTDDDSDDEMRKEKQKTKKTKDKNKQINHNEIDASSSDEEKQTKKNKSDNKRRELKSAEEKSSQRHKSKHNSNNGKNKDSNKQSKNVSSSHSTKYKNPSTNEDKIDKKHKDGESKKNEKSSSQRSSHSAKLKDNKGKNDKQELNSTKQSQQHMKDNSKFAKTIASGSDEHSKLKSTDNKSNTSHSRANKDKDSNTKTKNINEDSSSRDKTKNTNEDSSSRNKTKNSSEDSSSRNKTKNTSEDSSSINKTKNTSEDSSSRTKTKNTNGDSSSRTKTKNTNGDSSSRTKTQNNINEDSSRNKTKNTSEDSSSRTKTKIITNGDSFSRNKTKNITNGDSSSTNKTENTNEVDKERNATKSTNKHSEKVKEQDDKTDRGLVKSPESIKTRKLTDELAEIVGEVIGTNAELKTDETKANSDDETQDLLLDAEERADGADDDSSMKSEVIEMFSQSSSMESFTICSQLLLDEAVADQDETASEQDKLAVDQEEPASDQTESVADQDESIADQDESVADQDESVADQDEPVADQDESVADQDEPVADQDESAADQDKPDSEQYETESVADQDESIADQDKPASEQYERESEADQDELAADQDEPASEQEELFAQQTETQFNTEQQEIKQYIRQTLGDNVNIFDTSTASVLTGEESDETMDRLREHISKAALDTQDQFVISESNPVDNLTEKDLNVKPKPKAKGPAKNKDGKTLKSTKRMPESDSDNSDVQVKSAKKKSRKTTSKIHSEHSAESNHEVKVKKETKTQGIGKENKKTQGKDKKQIVKKLNIADFTLKRQLSKDSDESRPKKIAKSDSKTTNRDTTLGSSGTSSAKSDTNTATSDSKVAKCDTKSAKSDTSKAKSDTKSANRDPTLVSNNTKTAKSNTNKAKSDTNNTKSESSKAKSDTSKAKSNTKFAKSDTSNAKSDTKTSNNTNSAKSASSDTNKPSTSDSNKTAKKTKKAKFFQPPLRKFSNPETSKSEESKSSDLESPAFPLPEHEQEVGITSSQSVNSSSAVVPNSEDRLLEILKRLSQESLPFDTD